MHWVPKDGKKHHKKESINQSLSIQNSTNIYEALRVMWRKYREYLTTANNKGILLPNVSTQNWRNYL